MPSSFFFTLLSFGLIILFFLGPTIFIRFRTFPTGTEHKDGEVANFVFSFKFSFEPKFFGQFRKTLVEALFPTFKPKS